jgi:hypothetical protein
MYLLPKVAPRGEGMGWKIIKFHCITHMVDDIKILVYPVILVPNPMRLGTAKCCIIKCSEKLKSAEKNWTYPATFSLQLVIKSALSY